MSREGRDYRGSRGIPDLHFQAFMNAVDSMSTEQIEILRARLTAPTSVFDLYAPSVQQAGPAAASMRRPEIGVGYSIAASRHLDGVRGHASKMVSKAAKYLREFAAGRSKQAEVGGTAHVLACATFEQAKAYDRWVRENPSEATSVNFATWSSRESNKIANFIARVDIGRLSVFGQSVADRRANDMREAERLASEAIDSFRARSVGDPNYGRGPESSD